MHYEVINGPFPFQNGSHLNVIAYTPAGQKPKAVKRGSHLGGFVLHLHNRGTFAGNATNTLTGERLKGPLTRWMICLQFGSMN